MITKCEMSQGRGEIVYRLVEVGAKIEVSDG